MNTLRTFAVLALVPGLAGCALFPRAAAWVDFKAVQLSEVHRFSREDGYYNSAAAANWSWSARGDQALKGD